MILLLININANIAFETELAQLKQLKPGPFSELRCNLDLQYYFCVLFLCVQVIVLSLFFITS